MPFLLNRPVLSGLFLIDKPAGPTSHDAVLWARRVLNTKDVGHCGSLDPLATGLLLLVLGEALSRQNEFMAERKSYGGVIRLGRVTDTDDLAGKPLEKSFPRKTGDLTETEIRRAFDGFRGTFEQEVPTYSAVKVQGKPLYEWARKGVAMERPKKSVTIHALTVTDIQGADVSFHVDCSKGFYVRALARDVGEKLGVGGVLAGLCRESIGAYSRKNAYPWKDRSELDVSALEKAFIPIEKLPDA